jgi:hypothetical protein
MPESNCSACRYFVDFQQMGQCRRYPAFVNRHRNEGCGEFATVAEIISFPALVAELKPKRKYERKADAKTSI